MLNYLQRHWYGQFPLGRAYWVNHVLCTGLWGLATTWVVASGCAQWLGMRASGCWALGVFFAGLALCVWSAVGVWRSAARHAARGGRRAWGRLARVAVSVMLLRVAVAAVEQAPTVNQSLLLAAGHDTMPPASLHVVNRGREIKIDGGMPFGTAQRLQTLLDATPSVRMVQINSVGGWIAEGAKMGRLVREHGLATYTAGECDSACVLVFMAGSDRLLGSTALLGFHEASIAGLGGPFGSYGTRRLREAFERQGVPEHFIDRALSTPSSRLWYPTLQELIAAHVVTAVVDQRREARAVVVSFKRQTPDSLRWGELPL